jgi:hypothetical protein
MKCYACRTDTDKKEWNELKGYFAVDRSDGYHQNVRDVDVLVCPRCGTLRIDEYWLDPPDKEDR